MPYYLVKFDKNGRAAGTQSAPEKLMFECLNVSDVRDRADVAAENGGGSKAILQLFNEVGLVATRTKEGVWTH